MVLHHGITPRYYTMVLHHGITPWYYTTVPSFDQNKRKAKISYWYVLNSNETGYRSFGSRVSNTSRPDCKLSVNDPFKKLYSKENFGLLEYEKRGWTHCRPLNFSFDDVSKDLQWVSLSPQPQCWSWMWIRWNLSHHMCLHAAHRL